MRKYDLESIPRSSDLIDDGDEIDDVLDFSALSEYKLAAVSYIAGFAAKMAKKKLACNICENALGSQRHQYESHFLSFKEPEVGSSNHQRVFFISSKRQRNVSDACLLQQTEVYQEKQDFRKPSLLPF